MVDRLQRALKLLFDSLTVRVAFECVGIPKDVASQWPDLHGMPTPARRFDPRVFRAFVDFFDGGASALGLRTQLVIGLGDAVPRVQAFIVVRVVVPRVGDELLHLLRIARINRKDLVPVAIENRAARQLVGTVVVIDLGVSAIVHHVGRGQTAAMQPAFLFVDGADGQHVRYINVAAEGQRFIDAGADEVQPFHVQRGTGG